MKASVVIPALGKDRDLAVSKAETLKGNDVVIDGSPGLGMATKRGILAARGAKVAVMDCDTLHPVELLPFMLRELEYADLVKASRRDFGSGIQGFLSARGNWLARKALGLPVRDCTTCYYVGYRDKLLEMPDWVWRSPHGSYMLNVLFVAKNRGWRIAEVMYDPPPPSHDRQGHKKVAKHSVQYIDRIIRLWLMARLN